MAKPKEERKKPGPKTKYDEVKLREAAFLASYGLTLEDMAAFWGVCKDTVINWENEYEEFSTAIKKGRTEGVVSVTQALSQKARKGDTTACIFWLKNRAPHLWKDRREERVEHTIGAPTWTEQRIVDPTAIDAEQVVIDAAKAIEDKRKKKAK